MQLEPGGGVLIPATFRIAATPNNKSGKKKSRNFAANVAFCFLKLGEKTSVLKRIPL